MVARPIQSALCLGVSLARECLRGLVRLFVFGLQSEPHRREWHAFCMTDSDTADCLCQVADGGTKYCRALVTHKYRRLCMVPNL